MAYKHSVLALKNIRNRGIRSWLTILGIFIGIAAVVALVSLGNAMENAISEQFTGRLDPYRITISGKGIGMGTGGFDSDDVNLINSIRGVDYAVPRYTTLAEIKYRGDSQTSPMTNIPEDSRGRNMIYQSYGFSTKEGRLFSEGDRGVVILGRRVAESSFFRTDIKVGDNVEIRKENFRVLGILDSTGNHMLDQAVLILKDDMERIFDYKGKYHSIDVKVMYRNEIEEVSNRIKDSLRSDRRQKIGEEDFEVETALEAAEAAENILNTISIIVLGIALISLFVGGVGVTNTMYTSVLERRKEIGIMKAVGAKNRDIFSLFLIEAGLMGLAGGIIGSAFGLSLAYLSTIIVNSFLPTSNFNVTLSLPLLSGVIAFSFFVGTISGILPAMQASKLNPVDSLRK